MTASSPAIPAGAPPAPPPDFPRNGCCGACWGRCPRFSGVATAFLTCLGIVAGALMLASSSNLLLLPLTALPVRSPFAAARRARSRNASAALCARQTRLCTRRTLHAPHTPPHAPLHAPPPRRRRAAAVARVRAAAAPPLPARARADCSAALARRAAPQPVLILYVVYWRLLRKELGDAADDDLVLRVW